jgi:hypothetical protein
MPIIYKVDMVKLALMIIPILFLIGFTIPSYAEETFKVTQVNGFDVINHASDNGILQQNSINGIGKLGEYVVLYDENNQIMNYSFVSDNNTWDIRANFTEGMHDLTLFQSNGPMESLTLTVNNPITYVTQTETIPVQNTTAQTNTCPVMPTTWICTSSTNTEGKIQLTCTSQ